MSITIKKVYSDNPYVDEMVYYTMQLGIYTTLKLKQKADDGETLESLRASGNYISCIEGNAILETFDFFPYEVLTSFIDDNGKIHGAYLPQDIAKAIYLDPKKVSTLNKENQQLVLDAMKVWYPKHYEEKNNYYRMLNGLPPIDYEDIYVESWRIPDNYNIDISLPLHEMDEGDVSMLDTLGVLDDLYEIDPKNRGFIKHLGKKKIDIYLARKAGPFEPLYIPSIDSDSIRNMYIEKLNNNIIYTIRTIYSEAYKYNSDYYDNVISIIIVLMTMVDIISRVQEFITRKEIFDIRSCEYLFESYGVDFYEEIPLRYQIAMVKNINTLLKYKSTSKCMIDICSLFGFENIKIFKYYLLKDRNIDPSTGDYSYTGDNNQDFSLKFIKVPLDENISEYINQESSHFDYDSITLSDLSWDGGLDHEYVKSEVLKEKFNIIRTKYISIDSIYDIARVSIEQSYFFNMLYDDHKMEEDLYVTIPFIDPNHSFKLYDVFSMLTSLSYYYYGVSDTIMDTNGKVLHVNGFNFKADLSTLATYIANSEYEVDDALNLLNSFQVTTKQIPSFEQMMAMYVNNLDVRDKLIEGMKNADNKDIFSIYENLYNALMVVELNLDHFKDPDTGDFYRDSNGDATYTEYFRNKEPLFYHILTDSKAIDNNDSRKKTISYIIDNIVIALDNYIDLDEFQSFLHSIPAVSADSVQGYIAKIINFYKSYKIDFLGVNSIYHIDDGLDGDVHIKDKIFNMNRSILKTDHVKVYDLQHEIKVNTTLNDSVSLKDTCFIRLI